MLCATFSSQVSGRGTDPRGREKLPELFVQGVSCPITVRRVAPPASERPVGGIRMEKYENLGMVGEGSYGRVLKCRHKETGQHVAIKKFLESEDDKMVKKIAMREIRMLKQLRHDNLVNLIEVFRRKKRLYLVFEFVDHTVLDDLEKFPSGLDEAIVRRVLWQVLKGIEFCHLHNIIHRDVKPENILVSKSGIVKLCDFGFARVMAQPGEAYTDYVATRWYRAPELLVGDTKYGRAVDIWAVGCLAAEMLTGDPLFPGDSDLDQLFHIVKCFGNLTQRHREIFLKNPLFIGMRLPEVREVEPLERKLPRISHTALMLMKESLQLEATDRPTCSQLLRHAFFTKDGFSQKFPAELRTRVYRENQQNPLLMVRTRANKNAVTEGGGGNEEDMKENGLKKKKSKERQDIGEEKPKRKLPDPEKFIKKTPTVSQTVSNITLSPKTQLPVSGTVSSTAICIATRTDMDDHKMSHHHVVRVDDALLEHSTKRSQQHVARTDDAEHSNGKQYQLHVTGSNDIIQEQSANRSHSQHYMTKADDAVRVQSGKHSQLHLARTDDTIWMQSGKRSQLHVTRTDDAVQEPSGKQSQTNMTRADDALQEQSGKRSQITRTDDTMRDQSDRLSEQQMGTAGDTDGVESPVVPSLTVATPCAKSPVITRVSEKTKKQANYYKKSMLMSSQQQQHHHHPNGVVITSNPSHMTAAGPILQLEKTSLHEKTLKYDKMTKAKRRAREERVREERGREERREERGLLMPIADKSGWSLPEVPGAEGNLLKSNKTKKSYLSMMPNINNQTDSQIQESSRIRRLPAANGEMTELHDDKTSTENQ